MTKRTLGRTGLSISPLALGGNVFGWTADRDRSFELLDRFTDAGLETIDTADVYSVWVPGHKGGESESIVGDWMKARHNRHKITVVTKVGHQLGPDRGGLSGAWIVQAVEDSLRRLQTDRIDLYFSHIFDPKVPLEETLGAYAKLMQAGKVRAIGASNHTAEQLAEALSVAQTNGLPRYEVLQTMYNLYDRDDYEGSLRPLVRSEGLGLLAYSGLASGFLTGKYRSESDLGKSPRGDAVKRYLNEHGRRILTALDEIAQERSGSIAEVALAWLITRDDVTAPIASATNLDQVESLIRSTKLVLSAGEIAALNDASKSGIQRA